MRLHTADVADALSLLQGHRRFLERNTGTTNDPTQDFFVINEEGVLANNRHYLSNTAMEYHPNGDATTEGQSLLIIGCCYAYMATGDTAYLNKAKAYWQAYVTYFYRGQAIPDTPQRWIANWIVNGKEPVLANYPLNPQDPTHAGWKGVELTFTNGQTLVPHGAPYWGEYLDKATFAFDGALAYDSIKASVKALNPDNSTDWDNDGTVYPVDWIITWTGKKVDSNGDVVSQGHTPAEFGTVQLQDTGVNGVHKFNFATRNPVEHGGYLIGRNEVQHNRPLHVPLTGPVNQMGNAADGEVWFADACYLLWKLTDDADYKKALDCVLFTAHEYTLIDSQDKFFRQSTFANTPFTDGISYDYTYPGDAEVSYIRNAAGYVEATLSRDGDLTLEQQSIFFRVDSTSLCRTTFGGLDTNGAPLSAEVVLTIGDTKHTGDTQYVATLPASVSASPVAHTIPLAKFARLANGAGEPYILANGSAVTEYGAVTWFDEVQTNVLSDRDARVVRADFADDSGGFIIGFWLLTAGAAPLTSITYTADAEFDLRFEDDDGWRWYWVLPNTNGAWSTFTLNPAALVLSGYQPNHPSDPDPAGPVFTLVDQLTVLLENASDTNKSFTYYCINDVPPLFNSNDGYTRYYTLTLSGNAAFTAHIGDCTMLNTRDDALAYCPGVIPFSNIYQEGSEQLGAWHGLPYPGYQSPLIYTLDFAANDMQKLLNCVDFLYDSQQWYHQEFGVLGPGASAYIWDRWDAVEYGPANTWTMYHWGDGTAWSGYQPRAFCWAARAWQELVSQGKTVPPKLVQYVDNWAVYLADFASTHGRLPETFPSDQPPQAPQGRITAHMTGLWLAGACFAAMAGSEAAGLSRLIELAAAELKAHYIVVPTPGHPMSGSWSPWESPSDNSGMFYGFWSGEVMRGLALYVLWKRGRRADTLFN
ncbi:hypothetical protein [Spongiibacter sp. UBA1325]|uniref:hypothetical protein n=1 Tax=Spongiibacter sp. UBA1325 TaxID=1947543 RepID=UPI00257D6DCD|nr:hypothetical protein [Spongiibacter sp. UBA1325]|tara:strand:- start:696 stop:3479 length:2784 start_codon:yes stop_codon:yes gene_type:complete